MKVTMKKLWAGPDGIKNPGETVTVSKAQGERLIASRSAVKAADDPAPAETEPKPRKKTTRKTTAR